MKAILKIDGLQKHTLKDRSTSHIYKFTTIRGPSIILGTDGFMISNYPTQTGFENPKLHDYHARAYSNILFLFFEMEIGDWGITI